MSGGFSVTSFSLKYSYFKFFHNLRTIEEGCEVHFRVILNVIRMCGCCSLRAAEYNQDMG